MDMVNQAGLVCLFVCLLFYLAHRAACSGILVLKPGIEAMLPAVEA